MKVSTLAQVGILNAAAASAADYIWPSKYDYMEDLLYLQGGYIREGFIDGVAPCSRSSGGPERQTAAEWVRTAFHDMATHDASTGTGGLDASIQFETLRGENAGDAFNATFDFAKNYFTVRSSAADLIALSTVVAVGACDGPKIPLRVGRIDATDAGVAGVPEPDQDIETHKQKFAKAGFNTEDMIAMVACGHSLGGVHGKTFPQITGNDAEDNVMHFDSNNTQFDQTVVTEYLDDSTSNPLVIAANDTFNSDKRIFSADGNKTMNELADPAKFRTMCADIFERMINTVPKGVELSEPLEPSPIKPYISQFGLKNSTHIALAGRIRVYTDQERADAETVTLEYTPRDKPEGDIDTTITTIAADFRGGTSVGVHSELFKWHEFEAVIPVSSSIKSFNVIVTNSASGDETTHRNGGQGFPLDDAVMFQAAQSCVQDGKATFVAAVRNEVVEAKTPVTAEMALKVARQGTVMPMLKRESWEGEAGKKVGAWTLVTIEKTAEEFGREFDIVAGEHKVEFLNVNQVALGQCKPLE